MSIINPKFSAACLICALYALAALAARAQEIEATIKITPPATVAVEGRLIKKRAGVSNVNWSFLNSIAGAENLAARILEFNLSDEQNRAIAFRKLADGEYLAEAEANNFNYQMNLSPPEAVAATAHVSRLSGEAGFLMLGDLLPQFGASNQPISARIKFDAPTDWKIISGEKSLGDNVFAIKNVERAIFAAGKHWRERKIPLKEVNLNLAISGEWQFSDAEAAEIIGEIYETHRKMFGEASPETAQIFLLRFPKDVKFGRWTAEARGANVTILSADMPFKTQSIQRLHEQLRHEILHLWMPNDLALTGNYDWFYEGFTVYQALRTGVAMNQIRFEDYLATLAAAYNLDRRQTRRLSLLEASETRRSGANREVYARGMLTAFLCDAALLRASRGKRSISNVLREIHRKHRAPNEPADGSAAILSVLKNYAELAPIIEKYIAGREQINWETDLQSLGIELTDENSAVKLAVKARLNGKQKDLLDKLGYNNWRKSSGIRK